MTSAAGASAIPVADLGRWDGTALAPGVTGRVFTTDDNRRLMGLHVKAARETRGFVLVAHGNAMLAEHILPVFQKLASPWLDIVLYDDRGYGRSEGTTRFLAMFADARLIFRRLKREIGGVGFAYGLSQGGIVVGNAFLDGTDGARGVVIDSAPGDLPWYLCSPGFDPADRLEAAALPGAAIMVISGGRDHVISRDWMRRLIMAGQNKGAHVVLRDDFTHPFQEPTEVMLMERLGLIWAFFDGRMVDKP